MSGNRWLTPGSARPSSYTPTSNVYDGNNRLLSSTGAAYDSSGNLTQFGGAGFAYDAENRQISVNGGSVTYGYDGDGRRGFAPLAGSHQYPDAMGYGKHFEAIVRAWRPATEASQRKETL